MAHMDRISMGDIHGVHDDYKRSRALQTSFYLLGGHETLCVNGSKRGYRSFCTRARGLNAYV